MIGDNPAADVIGAEAVGIKGILVHGRNPGNIKYHSIDLSGVKEIIS